MQEGISTKITPELLQHSLVFDCVSEAPVQRLYHARALGKQSTATLGTTGFPGVFEMHMPRRPEMGFT